jgi:hypothetical protein
VPLHVAANTASDAAPQRGLYINGVIAAQTAGGVTVPVAGTTSKGGKFVGNFRIRRFDVVNNQVVAVGTLTGTIQNAAGNVIGTVLRTISLVTTITGASCEILHLELGPLDLNLLGLEVHLNRIVLDIDADPTGGLLGALLCAVANLLNIGGPLADIAALLNQILALL